VTEEAQKARIAAQMLPMVGPEEGSTVAVPRYALETDANPDRYPPGGNGQPAERLTTNSAPELYLTTISINVPLRSHEMADPNLNAALGMFRRAANYIARVEDALVFNGRARNAPPPGLQIPAVYTLTGDRDARGLVQPLDPNRGPGGATAQRVFRRFDRNPPLPRVLGTEVTAAIIGAIGDLDARGQGGPYACALSQSLFEAICTPQDNLVLPRDRVLPFLQGPLLRASTIEDGFGVVVSLTGNSVELVVGGDLNVRFLQTTLEPRYVFRVSERVALRIREENAIAVIEATI
jgi:uncharacterized linocin/CFP29 family protein